MHEKGKALNSDKYRQKKLATKTNFHFYVIQKSIDSTINNVKYRSRIQHWNIKKNDTLFSTLFMINMKSKKTSKFNTLSYRVYHNWHSKCDRRPKGCKSNWISFCHFLFIKICCSFSLYSICLYFLSVRSTLNLFNN